MNNQTIDQIISNLSKCDYDFALSVILTNFKGSQKDLLVKFLNSEISVDYLKKRWGQVNITGTINEDAKNEDLTILDRLKLISIILDKLNLKNTYSEVYKKAHNTPDDYARSLALLIHDLQNKDRLRVRNKEIWVGLLDKIRTDATEELELETQYGLLPHEPENYNCELPLVENENTESVTEETEEIEVTDVEAIVI